MSTGTLILTLGGMGDTVLALPALRRLRRLLPGAKLDAVAMWPQSADLLQDLGVFDRVEHFTFQTASKWASLRKAFELRHRRYDLSLMSAPANRWEYLRPPLGAAWLGWPLSAGCASLHPQLHSTALIRGRIAGSENLGHPAVGPP